MAKKLVSVFLEKEQETRLDKLSAKTRVPKAVYIREGIDFIESLQMQVGSNAVH